MFIREFAAFETRAYFARKMPKSYCSNPVIVLGANVAYYEVILPMRSNAGLTSR